MVFFDLPIDNLPDLCLDISMLFASQKHHSSIVKTCQRNIFFTYLYGLSTNFMFYWVVANLIYLDRGVNTQQLVSLGIVFSIVLLLLELPGGSFADKYGPQKALFISLFFNLIKVVLILFSHNYAGLLLASIANGVDRAFEHGVLDALFFENYKAQHKSRSYLKAIGMFEFFRLSSYSIAAILGSFIASKFGFNLVIIMSFFSLIVAVFAVFSLRDITSKHRRSTRKKIILPFTTMIGNACKTAYKTPGITNLIVFQAAITTLAVFMWDYNELFFLSVDLPVALFGIATAIMSWSEGLPQIFAARLFSHLPKQLSFAWLLLIGSFNLILASLFPSFFGLFFFLFAIVIISFSYPLCLDYMNHRIPSLYRSTIISLNFFIQCLLYLVFGLIFSYLIEIFGTQPAYSFIGFAGFIYGLYYFWLQTNSQKL